MSAQKKGAKPAAPIKQMPAPGAAVAEEITAATTVADGEVIAAAEAVTHVDAGADDNDAVAEIAEVIAEAPDGTLSVLLVAAIAAAPSRQRGALEAIQTSLQELKHRAAGVREHLGVDLAHLIERIHAL